MPVVVVTVVAAGGVLVETGRPTLAVAADSAVAVVAGVTIMPVVE